MPLTDEDIDKLRALEAEKQATQAEGMRIAAKWMLLFFVVFIVGFVALGIIISSIAGPPPGATVR